MLFEELKIQMREQLRTKELFEQAKACAYQYVDDVGSQAVFPPEEALSALRSFDEPLPDAPASPSEILELLSRAGSHAAVAQSGGRYFGFVNGSYFPVAVATKWISDLWDQNSALFVSSPIAAKLEEVCERWIVKLLGLPAGTAAGFVSGSSTAILCALATARNEILFRQSWDVSRDGLFGAPPVRVVLGEQAHSSVFKALALLGLGRDRVELAEVDAQGRIIPERLPRLDGNTLLIAQAGNVNSGAFDPLDRLAGMAVRAGAWLHVDGAFGLWAAASPKTYPLIQGFEQADSWSADAHKTLNAPYDCGIVLCRDRTALVRTMQATGSYIQYSDNRDPMLYTPEMSRRARGVELWATLRYLGKSGVGALVEELCKNAVYFAQKLTELGFTVLNDVVFNQVLVSCGTSAWTEATLKEIQASGRCWCGGAQWFGESVIRISVCSWQTSESDIDACAEVFAACREKAGR